MRAIIYVSFEIEILTSIIYDRISVLKKVIRRIYYLNYYKLSV